MVECLVGHEAQDFDVARRLGRERSQVLLGQQDEATWLDFDAALRLFRRHRATGQRMSQALALNG